MSPPHRGIAAAVILLVLGTSCGRAEPAPEDDAPVISGLDDRTVAEGGIFARISLADHVTDANDPDEEIAWSFSGNVELEVVEVGRDVIVRAPDDDWSGAETIRFEACDPSGRCDAREVVFTVTPENDPPVVSEDLIDQLIAAGETFAPIALDGFVSDVDDAVEEMSWECSGNADLEVSIVDRVATVAVPDPGWTGSETIRFQGCDPAGLCGATEAVFTVTSEPGVLVTFLCNEGFLISSGEDKILVDGLFDHCSYAPCSPSRIGLLENALPPFDGVDLVLITHHHYDHFDALIVGRHMENNPRAILVSTEETVSRLGSQFPRFDGIQDRVVAIPPDQGERVQATLNGIDLEMMSLPHTGPNIGFLIDLPGGRVLHMGDTEASLADVQPYHLSSEEIDVVFVSQYQLMEDPSPVLEGMQARYMVPMHFPPGDITGLVSMMEAQFPQAVFFEEQMQSWVVPR